jgi:hypothetical protein
MFQRDQPFLRAATKYSKTALACLALLFVFAARAQADTLSVAGFSGSQTPPGVLPFITQGFSHDFNVTSAGQTFDFVFGRYSVTPSNSSFGISGCTNGPCVTLTGALTAPAGQLSFVGGYSSTTSPAESTLSVEWASGGGPFAFTTAEGGAGQFTIQLLDFSVTNSTGAAQLYDQLARITVTQFTPGAATPTPEPATLLLSGTGLAAVAAARRRRRSRGKG